MLIFVAFLFVGVAVDSSGKVQAKTRAEAVAGEAARAGANALSYAPAKVTDVHLAHHRSQAAAERYLSAAGMTGTVSVDGRRVTVTATSQYEPIFLRAVGIGTQTVTGTATARLTAPGE